MGRVLELGLVVETDEAAEVQLNTGNALVVDGWAPQHMVHHGDELVWLVEEEAADSLVAKDIRNYWVAWENIEDLIPALNGLI
jgi:hypothetical protein